MFENISASLQQCAVFFISGMAMGLFYEFFRGFRMAFFHRAGIVFIEDILYFSLCGIASFIIALTVGIGYFRIYYIVFEALGAGVYFLTVGRIIRLLMKKLILAVKRLIFAAYRKISPSFERRFVSIAKKIGAWFGGIAENFNKLIHLRRNSLKMANDMVYNEKTPKALSGGGGKGAVKARIRR